MDFVNAVSSDVQRKVLQKIITRSDPEIIVQQDNVMVAVMLLAGCLSYSNSAMNPILYAFLSENFKKSFMKACTCANMRDANAALQIEPSMLPRRRTLAGMGASARNAAKNRFQQNKDNSRQLTRNGSGEGLEPVQ